MQRNLQEIVGATLVANCRSSRLKSLLQIIGTSVFSAFLRDNRMSDVYADRLGLRFTMQDMS